MTHDHAGMIDRREAVDRVCELRDRILDGQTTERVALDEISGRRLAKDVVASTDRPPQSHATMDGYAFDATDDYPLRLRDEAVFPEDDPPLIESGETVRIFTGASLPETANAVLKQEDAAVEDGLLRGIPTEPGTYTYERGSNVREGETLFEAGERLSPKDAILLGDLGMDSVRVSERFDACLLATGTEIHDGRIPDLDSPMLAGLLRSWGHHVTNEGTVPDEYDRVRSRIAALAEAYDVVVTTGGTSVGEKDHVVTVLDDLGDVLFHRVRVRPGKPIAVAELNDDDTVVIAIPGKPLGAHTSATLVARPFFVGRTALPTIRATLRADIGLGPEGFEYVVPISLRDGDAVPLGHVDSPLRVYEETFDPSVLSSSTRATRADGFLVTERDRTAGDRIDVVPYAAVE